MTDKLPIIVNGAEKLATGLNKTTTIGDVKYAMLVVTEPDLFKTSESVERVLTDYAVFERWQDNERMLDDRIKVYKLLRLWKSLPGDQLSSVKFVIKTRRKASASSNKLRVRSDNSCTRSPERPKSSSARRLKVSYLKKQLLAASSVSSKTESEYGSTTSVSSQDQENAKHNRYASIKQLHKAKKSHQKENDEEKLKQSFINLVNMQSELIGEQMNKLSIKETGNKISNSRSVKARSKSLDKSDLTRVQSQMREYLTAYKSYFDTETELNEKLTEVNELKKELELLKRIKEGEKMNSELSKLDDIIGLKQKYVESLENELKILEELSDREKNYMKRNGGDEEKNEDMTIIKSASMSSTSSDGSSKLSFKSTSSSPKIPEEELVSFKCQSTSDNESDTGISSVNSDDLNNAKTNTKNNFKHLETLV